MLRWQKLQMDDPKLVDGRGYQACSANLATSTTCLKGRVDRCYWLTYHDKPASVFGCKTLILMSPLKLWRHSGQAERLLWEQQTMVMSLYWDDHAGNAIRTTPWYEWLQRIAYFQPHTQPHTRTHIICVHIVVAKTSQIVRVQWLWVPEVSRWRQLQWKRQLCPRSLCGVCVQCPYCWWLELASWGGLAEKGASTFIEDRI